MKLEEAQKVFLTENSVLLREKERLAKLIGNIESLLPLAVKKIRHLEDFQITFWCRQLHNELLCNQDFEFWEKFIIVEDNNCVFWRVGDYKNILNQEKYCQEIESHFNNLGWKCKVIGRCWWGFDQDYQIKINYPRKTIFQIWKEKLLAFFLRQPKERELKFNPYREMPKCD